MAAAVNLGSVYGTIELRNKMQAGIDSAEKSLNGASTSITKKLDDIGGSFTKVGTTFTAGVTVPIVAGFGLAAAAAISFEDRLTDVAKTTGLEGEALKKFGEDIRSYSRDTSTSVDDLLTIAEIGGQLGIAQNDLLDFTKSLNVFNVAIGKDFAGGVEEAASQVGKIQTLFKQTSGLSAAKSIEKVGSAINELGAQGAGTTANITEFTLLIGQLPASLKPSVQDTLALATALEESGINARVGAGGLSNLFLTAGKGLPKFAKQMGISAAEASKLFKEDPTEFAKKFAESVKNLSAEQLPKTLKDLGIGTQETIKAIGALGTNTDRLTHLQGLANDAFEKGTSLQAEYEKKQKTTAAGIDRFNNNMKDLSVTFGSALLPIINELIEKVIPVIQKLVEAFQSLDPNMQKVIFAFLGLLAAIGPILLIIGQLATSISAIMTLGATLAPIIAGISAPFLLMAAAIAATAAALVFLAQKFGVLDALGNILRTIGLSVTKTIDTFKQAFQDPKVQAAILRFQNTIADLSTKLKPGFDRIGELVQKVNDFLVKAFGGEAGSSFISLENAVLAITVAFEALTVIADQLGPIFDAISFAIGEVVTSFEVAYGVISSVTTGIISFFQNFGTNVEAIKNGIIGFFNDALAQLGAFISAIPEMIGRAIGLTVGFLFALPGLAWRALQMLWTNILAAGENIRKFFMETLPGYIQAAINHFLKLPENAGKAVQKLGPSLVDQFIKAFQDLDKTIQGFVVQALNWGKNIMDAFIKGIAAGAEGIKKGFEDGLNSARSIIEGKSPPDAGPFKEIDKWGFNIGDAWSSALNQGLSDIQVPEVPALNQSFAQNVTAPESTSPTGTVNNITLDVSVDGYVGTPMQLRQIGEILIDTIEDIAAGRGVGLNVINT
jgi:TP901 family phage tail tape measure protein